MSMRLLVLPASLLVLMAASPAAPQPRPGGLSVQLNMATLHAAALTAARGGDDRADQPYLLASIAGPGTATRTARVPDDGHLRIQLDEAIRARPLLSLSLAPGEHARVVITALEGPQVDLALEGRVVAAATARVNESPSALGARLAEALAPLAILEDHWLGAALLEIANDAGTLRWRTFACLSTCKVLNAPEATTAPGALLAGVLELTGAGGTYHLQLETRMGR